MMEGIPLFGVGMEPPVPRKMIFSMPVSYEAPNDIMLLSYYSDSVLP
jgi:hypothetical protein